MRTMGFKPFYYRLPMRIRIWNLRREQREKWEFVHFKLLKRKRYKRKPWVVKRAVRRALKLRNWGRLFDPEIPF